MRSPFEIFRKHQKILTVILTGLAMFAFVILGAVQDPSNMPPALVAIILAGALGGIGWMVGIKTDKSKEWGLSGAVGGVILGIAATFAVGPKDVVRADTGNIDQQQLQSLHQQRQIANQFVNNAVQHARENGSQFFRPPRLFGFGHPDPDRDVVVGELLRREADRLGLEISDEAVNDYIVKVSEGKLGPAGIKEIRDRIGISEAELYKNLKQELKSQEVANFLYSDTTLTPETYWEFYRKMNIQQSVGLVPVSIDAFVDNSVEPPEAELQALFDQHRTNYPNTTVTGQLDEGLVGFRQPRKVQLAYVEVPYEAVEKTVGEVSDEEIEAFYEEYYKTIPSTEEPSAETGISGPGAPILPEMKQPAAESDGETPAGGTKPETSQETPEADTPAPEEKSESPSPEPKQEKSPEESGSSKESDSASQPDSKTPDDKPSPPQEEGEASVRQQSDLQLVALFDDDSSAKSEESPDGEQPEPAGDEASAQTSPPPPATPRTREAVENQPLSGDAETQPAPSGPPKPRELDDELRDEIRDQILRSRTSERMQELVTEVYDFMLQDLLEELYAVPDSEEDESEGDQAPAYETAGKKLREFAEERGLVYGETPLLSVSELQDSEDHPIGRAASTGGGQQSSTVPAMAFRSGPSVLFRPESVLEIESGSRFVFWKINDEESYEPSSLDDPGIREQVVKTWRELQAREKAQARAQELAKQAENVEKPLSEIFAETTVTGEEGAQAVSVVHPPRFSWLSPASNSPNPFNRPPPTLTTLRTIPGRVGDDFMEKVVNDLQVGEVGVTHSLDQAYYYVVRVDDRTYGFSPDFASFRERFPSEPVFAPFGFSDYSSLAGLELQQYSFNWAQELFERHNVDFSQLDQLQSQPRG